MIAGHTALLVRSFLRRFRASEIDVDAAARELNIDEHQAQEFLIAIETLGLIEAEAAHLQPSGRMYSVTIKGNALASASAAKPIRRSTAEIALRHFITRLDQFDIRSEYVYRVVSAVLFGSMLSNSEHLADVDIAVELEPKIADEEKFGEWCDARRRLALKIGARFSNTMDREYWPQMEVFRALRARSRALSLHEWNQIIRIPGVRYSVLSGDRQRISGMISTGECVDHLLSSAPWQVHP
jgi:predicted nucleotidyltransferase